MATVQPASILPPAGPAIPSTFSPDQVKEIVQVGPPPPKRENPPRGNLFPRPSFFLPSFHWVLYIVLIPPDQVGFIRDRDPN